MTTNEDMYYWYRCAASVDRFVDSMDKDTYDERTINVIRAYLRGLMNGSDVTDRMAKE